MNEPSTTVEVRGDDLHVTFRGHGLDAYRLFLKAKAVPEYRVSVDRATLCHTITMPARFAGALGVAVPAPERADLPVAGHLFDDQDWIVRRALSRKRFAVWSDCGLGKTAVGLEFARHVLHRTGRRVLIVTLPEVRGQWVKEAEKFYGDALPVETVGSREEMRGWMAAPGPAVGVTNYEKWNPEDLDRQVVTEAKSLGGVVLDESSRLKSGGGRQKWSLIKSCRGVEYKLSLTATPAPNEVMEFASQAAFLEKLKDERDILWTYFRRDEKTNRWTVKAHARDAFFAFMSDWSIFLRDPRRYGWRADLPDVPEPETTVHDVPITDAQRAAWLELSGDPTGQRVMFVERDTNAIQRLKLAQVARGFRYRGDDSGAFDRIDSRKPGVTAGLVRGDLDDGRTCLVWTTFDAEAEVLADALRSRGVEFATLTGSTKPRERVRLIDALRGGSLRCLVTRPKVLAWGMNLQCVTSMIFHGFDDSYEQYYQAVRRAYRFGQTERLRVRVPLVRELEGGTWENLLRKAANDEAAVRQMESSWMRALDRSPAAA
jgi:hypothetical protein